MIVDVERLIEKVIEKNEDGESNWKCVIGNFKAIKLIEEHVSSSIQFAT